MLKLRVDEILNEQGKSMYWLSKVTGIAPNNIGKICSGETKNIRLDTIEKICKALDCPVSDLFCSDDPTMNRLIKYYSLLNEHLSK